MDRFITAAISCALLFLVSAVAYAGSAQWNLNPTSGDWNTAANWTPMTVPNGPMDSATFSFSNNTDVSISANTEVDGIVFTPAATNPYSIEVPSNLTLTLGGTGITNNSGIQHTLFLPPMDGELLFTDTSSASNSSILNYGLTMFLNSSTAGSSSIFNSNGLGFFDNSNASDADITIFSFSGCLFADNSSAASANIALVDSTSGLEFVDRSSAGDATIVSAGSVSFYGSSAASNASILVIGNFLTFSESSTGGTAQIELRFVSFRPNYLVISEHNFPGVTLGSLEGEEGCVVSLGSNNLTVGSNDLSTIFSGVIDDNGFNGSLTKIGKGTLDLKGANSYTGQTNINGGVLQVDGSISSNTFINHKGALAGGGTVYGNVTNSAGEVSPGDPLGVPGVLTVSNNYTQTPSASLTIRIAGPDSDQISLLNVVGDANLSGEVDLELVNGFNPAIGQSFGILAYGSVTGSFSHIRNQVFDNGRKRWSLVYQPTGATLVVVNNGHGVSRAEVDSAAR